MKTAAWRVLPGGLGPETGALSEALQRRAIVWGGRGQGPAGDRRAGARGAAGSALPLSGPQFPEHTVRGHQAPTCVMPPRPVVAPRKDPLGVSPVLCRLRSRKQMLTTRRPLVSCELAGPWGVAPSVRLPVQLPRDGDPRALRRERMGPRAQGLCRWG